MSAVVVPMVKYKFDWKPWFILDDNPEYFLMAKDIPFFSEISPKDLSDLIKHVFDEHRKLWESRGHVYEAGE